VLDALGWDYDRKHNILVGNMLKKSVGLEPCGRVRRGERRVTAYQWDAVKVERFIRRYTSKGDGDCQVVPSQGDRQPVDNLWTISGQSPGEIVPPHTPIDQEKRGSGTIWTIFSEGPIGKQYNQAYNIPPQIDCPIVPQGVFSQVDHSGQSLDNLWTIFRNCSKFVPLAKNVEWRPACRSLVAHVRTRKRPWQYLWADEVLSRLPQNDDYRIIICSDAGAWQVDSATFWAHAEVRPRGMILADPQLWSEIEGRGVR